MKFFLEEPMGGSEQVELGLVDDRLEEAEEVLVAMAVDVEGEGEDEYSGLCVLVADGVDVVVAMSVHYLQSCPGLPLEQGDAFEVAVDSFEPSLVLFNIHGL